MTTTPATGDPASTLPDPLRANRLWRFCRVVLRPVFIFWLDYRARGHDAIPDSGALVVANHESFIDPLMIGLPLSRPISYVARHNLFSIPVIGTVLRKTYVMPINRDSASTASIREASRRIQHGFLVGIFPEGTRSDDERLGDLKPGFIALLRHGKSPVVPVGLAGTGRALPRRGLWLRRGRVRVVCGPPIEWSEIEPLTGRGREGELLSLIRSRLLDVCGQAREWRDRVD